MLLMTDLSPMKICFPHWHKKLRPTDDRRPMLPSISLKIPLLSESSKSGLSSLARQALVLEIISSTSGFRLLQYSPDMNRS